MSANRRHPLFPCHYGWVIVLTGALTLFACLGLARFAFGMLLPALRSGLGLGFDEMGFISTGNFAGYLLSVAVTPWLLRRSGPRLLITCGLLLIALCMVGIGRSEGLVTVVLLYALIGVGSGFANIPVMVLVSHWFRRQQRGRAAGLMTMGNGVAIVASGLVIPLLNGGFGIDGWRISWYLIGGLTLGVALLAALLLRNDPAALGLEPVGEKRDLPESLVAGSEPPHPGRLLGLLGLLYLVFGITYMVYGTFIVTTMVVEYGFAEARAGLFWSWVGAFSLVSGVGFGILSDRIGRRRGLATVFIIQTAAYLLAGSHLGTAALLLSVLLYGIAAFAIPTIMAAAVSDYFGLSRAASAFSTVTLFFAVGQVFGPGAAGLLAEACGTFTVSFLLCGLLTGSAALLAMRLPGVGANGGEGGR
ncbi:major facilitator superfamily membrane protein [Desulfuromonas sp. DDH964]|uniref:MFS transporter n=1 Tax=Desulfuromonas sp. DDH964 TaxID=1823759 RepID=UPI00078D9760|nr:MFS transporter [Desulfuromonas sp. DDH964]AMV73429.1 major facilitator superfamily membrane protein [Desulfuromonas sp. DDH964]